jgi:hypothetical protein
MIFIYVYENSHTLIVENIMNIRFCFAARERVPMIGANYYLVKVKLNCCVVVLLVKDSVE